MIPRFLTVLEVFHLAYQDPGENCTRYLPERSSVHSNRSGASVGPFFQDSNIILLTVYVVVVDGESSYRSYNFVKRYR